MNDKLKQTYEEYIKMKTKPVKQKEIKEYLPSDLQDAKILFQENAKNNEVKEGIVIQKERITVSPILYLDWYDAAHPEKACRQIVSDYLKYIPEQENLSMERLLSYSLEDIKMKLISRKGNENLLCKVPYQRQLDLAFVPYLEINSEMLFHITYDYCRKKGWDPMEVIHAGMKNIRKDSIEFMTIEEKIAELAEINQPEIFYEIPKNEQLYILTNESGVFGAAQIGNPYVLRAIEQELGETFYILPSSVHEVMILAESTSFNPEELRAIVQAVNEEMVDLQEQLSNDVYRYSEEKGMEVYRDGRWFGQEKEVSKNHQIPKL